AALLKVRGVGQRKLADLGQRFLQVIADYCSSNGLALGADNRSTRQPSEMKAAAFELFKKGNSVEQVATATGRAEGTVWAYLAEFIESHPSAQLDPWVNEEAYRAVAAAAADLGAVYLKPIFERLGGQIPYGQIRAAIARFNSRADVAAK